MTDTLISEDDDGYFMKQETGSLFVLNIATNYYIHRVVCSFTWFDVTQTSFVQSGNHTYVLSYLWWL